MDKLSKIMNEKRYSNKNDLELVSLCRKGDLCAFEELVRNHQNMMVNVAFRMMGNYEDACEVVQDAFLSAYKNLNNFQERSKFSTWLCRIVINLSKNKIQKIKTRSYIYQVKEEQTTQTINLEPDMAYEKKQDNEIINRCLDKLDADFKLVLVLREINGLSYIEISETLGLAQGTVKSRLYRAKIALKECLKNCLGARVNE